MRRVLIVGSGSLFGEGLTNLLGAEADFQVSGLACDDEMVFLQETAYLRPDVILLNEDGPLDSARIFELLRNLPTLMSLKVILVRPDDNAIHVYDKKQVTLTRSQELFALIRDTDCL